MARSPIYFDENATASVHPKVRDAAFHWLGGSPSNPSSVHSLGRRARGAIEQSRRQLASALGVSPRHLTFTSSATEGLHTVICGRVSSQDHVLVSAVEHPAVWGALEASGAEVEIIPVNRDGQINPDHFFERKRPNTKLGIMMAAQNELGVIYPVHRVAEALGDVPLLVDAVQAFGKTHLNLMNTGATFAVVSGHKVGGLQGAAAIWAHSGEPFEPLLRGGAQERGRRAGTENVSAIVGLGVAASLMEERLKSMTHVWYQRERLRREVTAWNEVECLGNWAEVTQAKDLTPTWRQHGHLANTLCLHLPEHEGDLLLQRMDLAGFCLSSGSACSSGALSPSQTLIALGFSEQEATQGLRISMGASANSHEVDLLIECLRINLKKS